MWLKSAKPACGAVAGRARSQLTRNDVPRARGHAVALAPRRRRVRAVRPRVDPLGAVRARQPLRAGSSTPARAARPPAARPWRASARQRRGQLVARHLDRSASSPLGPPLRPDDLRGGSVLLGLLLRLLLLGLLLALRLLLVLLLAAEGLLLRLLRLRGWRDVRLPGRAPGSAAAAGVARPRVELTAGAPPRDRQRVARRARRAAARDRVRVDDDVAGVVRQEQVAPVRRRSARRRSSASGSWNRFVPPPVRQVVVGVEQVVAVAAAEDVAAGAADEPVVAAVAGDPVVAVARHDRQLRPGGRVVVEEEVAAEDEDPRGRAAPRRRARTSAASGRSRAGRSAAGRPGCTGRVKSVRTTPVIAPFDDVGGVALEPAPRRRRCASSPAPPCDHVVAEAAEDDVVAAAVGRDRAASS